MVKLIIFDFDGVIADSVDCGVEMFNSYVREHKLGDPISREELRSIGLNGLRERYRVPLYKMPFYMKHVHAAMSKRMRDLKPYPKMLPVLQRLHARYTLAIITSNSAPNVEVFLQHHKLQHLFNFIIAGVGIFGKASKMRKALSRAKVGKEQAVCVGDEVRDIDAARAAGIRCIAVTWGFNNRQLLEKHAPDDTIEGPADLIAAIEKLG